MSFVGFAEQRIESGRVSEFLCLSKLPTPSKRIGEQPVTANGDLNLREVGAEVLLKKMFEQTSGDSNPQIEFAFVPHRSMNDHTASGSDSMKSPTRMIACHRGSVSPSGLASPGSSLSAALIARSTVTLILSG